ncbi:MAG: RNA polymerase sigma factor (sigma-70 family) [Limisphaerales bacterium]|jgi:RNA polymerase sigma factor (sigma-70 family)
MNTTKTLSVQAHLNQGLTNKKTSNSYKRIPCCFTKFKEALVVNNDSQIALFYPICYQQILKYATSILKDTIEGEEAASHVIEKLLSNYTKIVQPTKWVLTVTKNWCFTQLTTKARRKYIQQNEIKHTVSFAISPDAYYNLAQHEVHQTMMQKLRKEEAEIINLKIKGYSNPEIASKLGISTKTVSNRTSIIRSKLKDSIYNLGTN